MRIEERLKESVALHGSHPAIVAGRACHSYAALDLKSDRLAATLQSGGVARGGRVVVFLDNGWEAAVSLFAVLKAGGVVVPVGAAAGADALGEIVRKSQPVAVITQSRLASTVAAAISEAASVRLVVLAGGDRARAGGTCISFEEAVGRIARLPALVAAGDDGDPAVLFDGETPLTHRQLAEDAAEAADFGDGVVLPPLAERAGLVRLLAAVEAGRTMMARSPFAPGDDSESAAALRRAESRFGIANLLDATVAGTAPAFQR